MTTTLEDIQLAASAHDNAQKRRLAIAGEINSINEQIMALNKRKIELESESDRLLISNGGALNKGQELLNILTIDRDFPIEISLSSIMNYLIKKYGFTLNSVEGSSGVNYSPKLKMVSGNGMAFDIGFVRSGTSFGGNVNLDFGKKTIDEFMDLVILALNDGISKTSLYINGDGVEVNSFEKIYHFLLSKIK